MCLCCTVTDIFSTEYYRDLKIWVRVVQGHWKWYHVKACVRFPIRIPQQLWQHLQPFRHNARTWHPASHRTTAKAATQHRAVKTELQEIGLPIEWLTSSNNDTGPAYPHYPTIKLVNESAIQAVIQYFNINCWSSHIVLVSCRTAEPATQNLWRRV